MSLKDIKTELSYSSKGDNFLNNLIIPALNQANSYKRSVGFFSSTVLDLLKIGLRSVISKGGKYNVICSPELSANDLESIRKGYEEKKHLRDKNFEEDLDELLLKMDSEDIDMLSFLISTGKMEVKIVDLEGSFGIYHDKIGIIEDSENNKIMFFGSPNESKAGYIDNYEKIRVFKSWFEGDLERIKEEEKEFDSIWNGENPYLIRIDYNNKILDKLARTLKDRNYQRNSIYTKEDSKEIKLREYQEEAINCWIKNGNRGFFVMATGTGKTWTAIYAAKKMFDKENVFLVICAPYKHLIKQWAEDIEKVFPDSSIIMVSGENSKWENELKDALAVVKYSDPSKKVIAISTIQSFNSDKFLAIAEKTKQKKMLIVDEAHRFTNRDNTILRLYQYMLGLSATPSNKLNDEKAKELTDYFGGEVYNLPIEYAINKGYLIHYNYYPIFVETTEEDEEKFLKYTRLMMGCFKNGKCINLDDLVKYKRARLRVISMAEEKTSKIKWILSQIKENDHFIVYCGDGKLFSNGEGDDIRHIQFIKNELDEMGYKVCQFTASEKMKERMQRVESFNKGMVDSMVAIRCLDEGINIPSIKGALLLSSNDDYREFIQRRGRILRKYVDEYTGFEKRKANIYDVIVCPSDNLTKFAEIELRRYYEYARLADNYEDCMDELDDLLFRYNLNIEDVANSESEGVEVELDE